MPKDKLPHLIAWLNEKGQEMPSNVPVAAPVHVGLPQSTHDLVRDLIRREVSQAAAESGFETEEEANDFDTGEDDEILLTPHEIAAMDGPQLEALLAPYKRPPVAATPAVTSQSTPTEPPPLAPPEPAADPKKP